MDFTCKIYGYRSSLPSQVNQLPGTYSIDSLMVYSIYVTIHFNNNYIF